MSTPAPPKSADDALRARAKTRLRACPMQRVAEPLARTQYELDVAHVELEIQNEELRAIEGDLEESRDRYAALFQLAPVGYLRLDRRGTILEANDAAAELLGEGATDLAGRRLSSFMPVDSADVLYRHLQAVTSTRDKVGCDVQIAGGGVRTIAVHIDSVALPDGESCNSVLIDVTPLQRAATAEARGATLLDTIADAVVTLDDAGTIQHVNAAAGRVFGAATEALVGRNLERLIPAFELHHDLRLGDARLSGPTRRRATGVRQDGTEFPVDVSIGQWWDGNKPRFTAIVRDRTQAELAQRELAESETLFRRIAEQTVDAVVVSERESAQITYASPAFETIFGRRGADVTEDPRGPLACSHPDDRGRLAEAERRYFRGGSFDEEYRIVRPDGEMRLVRARIFPIGDGDAARHLDVHVVQDITAERATQAGRQHAQKMEAIGALASGVAHDFNNVLQGVLGCIDVARADASTGRAKRFLDQATDSARRGGELAGQLMAFSRKRAVTPQPTALDPLVDTITGLLSRLIGKDVEIEIRAAAPGATIVADPVQLEQILLNLATNARDAMPTGGRLTITTGTYMPTAAEAARMGLPDDERYVKIVVADTGMGMDEETRKRIFEPFFTTKPEGKGTGLGLATVFALTNELAGWIDVDSEQGRGTRFELTLPCGPTATDARVSGPHPVPVLEGTVLLVEDEALVRMSVRHYLEQLGLDVLEATCADEALQVCALRKGEIDIMLSDIVMPRMSGPKLAELVRRRFPNLEVVLMSANPEVTSLRWGEGGRALPVLRKPFGLGDLARVLVRLGSEAVVDDPQATAHPRSQRTILLVEDDPSGRAAMGELLRSAGFSVVVASSAEDALGKVGSPPLAVDLLLTDVRLPGDTGEALAARLREQRPGLPVLYMSGAPDPGGPRRDFLAKPIDFEQLLTMLDRSLHRASAAVQGAGDLRNELACGEGLE